MGDVDKVDLHTRLALTSGLTKEELTQAYGQIGTASYDEFISNHSANRQIIGCTQMDSIFQGKHDIFILDVGAGTGLVGKELYSRGYKLLDALEPIDCMANAAEKTQVYRKMIRQFTGNGNRLDIPDGTYDALIAVGVFVDNHAKEDAFPELIRITKKGGYIIIVGAESYTKTKYMENFEPTMYKLEKEGKWKVDKNSVANYIKRPDGIEEDATIYTFKIM